MKVSDITINGIHEPLGYAMASVNISWQVTDTKSTEAVQRTVAVSTDPSFETLLYTYTDASTVNQLNADFPLQPRTRYYVRVKITGNEGDLAEASSWFETGKQKEPWAAEWIGPEAGDACHPILRKTLSLARTPDKARIYVTGVGLFELYVNGEKVGNEYLAPYVSIYETRLQAMTYDLADFLQEGENEVDILLGRGWYLGTFGLGMRDQNFGDRMAAITEMHVWENGKETVFGTDASWQYRASDTLASGIYDGEMIDRTRHLSGKEDSWKPVCVLAHPEAFSGCRNLEKSHISDRTSLPVTSHEILPVREILHTPAGETVLDFGQNFAGFVTFPVDASIPFGTKIKLEFGEILQQGNFYHKNYRDAKSEFLYVADGRSETVRPHFTFFGFRYVKITGWPREIRPDDFTGVALYSDTARTGFLETGHAKVNRLYENTLWSQRSNSIDLPTDCPQRSERLGWTGDAQVFAPTACYHMQMNAFYHHYEELLRDEQAFLHGGIPNFIPNIGHKDDCGAVWGDAGTFIPWTMYEFYGDKRELRQQYPMMRDWLEWIYRQDEGRSSGTRRLFDFGFSFGDWLALDGATETSFKGSTDDTYVASVYYYVSAGIAARAAAILGNTEDSCRYQTLAEEIRQAIRKEYVTPSGRLAIDTQTALLLALRFSICPDREKIKDQLRLRFKKDLYKIKGGFVGAPMMCSVLAENGMTDIAYDLLLSEQFPGWLYEVNLGATTIWERWNSVLPDGTISDTGMNSLNHYAYGSVMEFLYGYAAGIRPLKPGLSEAHLAPHPDVRLGHISCRYMSAAGEYRIAWTVQPDGTLTIQVHIPFGASARVVLPEDPEKRDLKLPAGDYAWSYAPVHDFRKVISWDSRLGKVLEFPDMAAILGNHLPMLVGMAHDPEMSCNTFRELKDMMYIPFDRNELNKAVEEMEAQIVTPAG